MSRIFITGSSDGLGQMAARLLLAQGHEVVLHGRNKSRTADALAAVPGAETALTGDLSSIAETVHLAEQVNDLGPFDAVIHNAGVGDKERRRIETADGLSHVFAINSLAPYILTCLINRPKRLIYLSSGLHGRGSADMKDLIWKEKKWNGLQAYSDSKLQDVILAFAFARKWPDLFSNALDPGWVATKMGGSSAPDSLEEGSLTQAWLAASNDPKVMVTGKYFYHQKLKPCHPAAADTEVQERFLSECARISGITLPLS